MMFRISIFVVCLSAFLFVGCDYFASPNANSGKVRHTGRLKHQEKLKPIETVSNSVGMDLVLVPEGKANDNSEIKSFYIGTHEVTQKQFQAVMGYNPSTFQGNDLPVNNLYWTEAVRFCEQLSSTESVTYRLPTEIEWEYACRAGMPTDFHYGHWITPKEANILGQGDDKSLTVGQAKEVGSYEPNSLGLYDMHGNVNEWCLNYLPSSGDQHIYRGGNGASPSDTAKSDYRWAMAGKKEWTGFRIVRTVKKEKIEPIAAKSIYRSSSFTTEEMIQKVDEAFAKPSPNLPDPVVILPTVDKDMKKSAHGNAITFLANFHSSSNTDGARLQNCFSHLHDEFVDSYAYNYTVKPKLDKPLIPVYLATAETKKYILPILSKEGEFWKLETTIREWEDESDKTKENPKVPIYVKSKDICELPTLFARSVLKQSGIELTKEQIEKDFSPTITSPEDLKLFGENLIGIFSGNWNQFMNKFMERNPKSKAIVWIYLRYEKHPFQRYVSWYQRDRSIISNDQIAFATFKKIDHINAGQEFLTYLLQGATEWKHDSEYFYSLVQLCHKIGDEKLTEHLLKVWEENDQSYVGKLYRGLFYKHGAFDYRGTSFSMGVSDFGWNGFRKFNQKAIDSFEDAISMNKLSWRAHDAIFSMGRVTHLPKSYYRDHFMQAKSIMPEIFKIYDSAFYVVQDRWGGTKEEAFDFANLCLEAKNWRTGIPDLARKILADHSTMPQSGAEDRLFYERPEVKEILDKYYDSALKNSSDDWKKHAKNSYARLSSYAGRREELGPLFEELEKGERDTNFMRLDATYEFLRDRAFSKSRKGQEKIEASIRHHLAVTEFDEAEKQLKLFEPKSDAKKKEKTRLQKALAIARKLKKEGKIKLTPEDFRDIFDGFDDSWKIEDDAIVWKGKDFETSTITLPFGFRYARIDGHISVRKRPQEYIVMVHTKSVRDIVNLVYRYDTRRRYWLSSVNRSVRDKSHIIYDNENDFKIYCYEDSDQIVPANGVRWTTPVINDLPGSLTLKVSASKGDAEVAFSNIEIELIE